MGAAGRIVVQPDLSLKNHPEVFVVGDMARYSSGGAPLPMMAPVASQQGDYAARAIFAREQGKLLQLFVILTRVQWLQSVRVQQWPQQPDSNFAAISRLARLAATAFILPDRFQKQISCHDELGHTPTGFKSGK